jgi:hypothetical protein
MTFEKRMNYPEEHEEQDDHEEHEEHEDHEDHEDTFDDGRDDGRDEEQEDKQRYGDMMELRMRLMEYETVVANLTSTISKNHETIRGLEEALLLPSESTSFHSASQHQRQHPLVEAVSDGRSETVRELALASGQVALDEALQQSCQMLRSHRIDGTGGPGGSNNRDILIVLLEAGADPNADHGNALLWAVHRGDAEAVRILLSRGADPRILRDLPAHIALRAGNQDVLKTLSSFMRNTVTSTEK